MVEMIQKIIVVNGPARSGKDSFAQFLKKHSPVPVFNHSTVGTIKLAAKFLGADEDIYKGEDERRLWSDMKDAWTRFCDGPFVEIIAKVEALKRRPNLPEFILIVHAREPEEIQKLKDYFREDFVSVLIERPTTEVPGNHADQNVGNFRYDVRINNNSTLDGLEVGTMKFVKIFA